jgi:hypothetical protein
MGLPRGSAADFEGANPSADVALYYYIRDEPDDDAALEIEIRDAAGALLRSYSSEESDQDRCKIANMDPRRPFELEYPTLDQGLNRWSWDLRGEELTCIDDALQNYGYDGPSVPPGQYTARVSIGESSAAATFTVLKDLRSFASDAEIADWAATLGRVKAMINEVLVTLDSARAARAGIEAMLANYDDEVLRELGEAAISGIDGWEPKINQLRHETYEDEDAWPSMLDGQLGFIMDVIDNSGAPVTDGSRKRLDELRADWTARQAELREITTRYIEPINRRAREQGMPHIAIPIAQ